MKNKELIKNLTPVAKKNLGKTFFTLFVMVILESICSALVIFSSYLFSSQKILTYLAMFAGVFLWFLVLIGFAIMLLRMAREKYVTLGYLFYGFRRIKLFAPVALLHTVLTAFSAGVAAAILLALRKTQSPVLSFLTQHWGENSILIATIILSAVLFLIFQFPQIFLAFLRYDNSEKSVFKLAFMSFKFCVKKLFKLLGFIFMAGGRNLFLAVFYFAVTLTLSGEDKGTLVQALLFLFDFLYFVNIYKAVSLMALSLPVFYEDVTEGL